MKGYPKSLNTKDDYEYVRINFPDQWQQDWQDLLDTMQNWIPIHELDSPDNGIVDDTHKIVEEQEEDNIHYIQYELQNIPTCKLYKLGFTEDYVKSVLNN